ncbi:hypothetical protein AB6G58_10175 [Providencia huaxiensis]
MINKIMYTLLPVLALLSGFYSSSVIAIALSNSYVFIENGIDDEYFVTPRSLDPRFTGANKFSRYSAKSQESLGYMGYTNTAIRANQNVDIWFENSPSTARLLVTAVCVITVIVIAVIGQLNILEKTVHIR